MSETFRKVRIERVYKKVREERIKALKEADKYEVGAPQKTHYVSQAMAFGDVLAYIAEEFDFLDEHAGFEEFMKKPLK